MARRIAASAALAAMVLSGCSMAPPYHVPVTSVPAAYKESAPWVPATPGDTAPRGTWWTAFGDSDLNALEARIEGDSPTLAAALARHEQALAAVGDARADLFPQASASASAGRQRVSARRPLSPGSPSTYDLYLVNGSIDYEVDLWGRIRNGVRATRAEAQATDADLAATRLALQTGLADAYFRLRGLDAQAELLRQTVAAYERAYQLTDTRHQGGIASGLDTSRSQTILASARAQISAIASARAAVEHSVAALIGQPASTFSLPPTKTGQIDPPIVPTGAPSTLLQRRPDIAAAERRTAAANARIGIARAAWFPSLTLGAGGGWEATGGALLSAPATFWAIGPIEAALTLFDGGRRAARVRQSRAVFDEAAADYRATVLTAFREAEDQIAAARALGAQEDAQRAAAAAAARTEALALTRYRDGASDYLDVVTAQTAALEAERDAIAIRTQRLQAAVALVRALGGEASLDNSPKG